MAPLLSASTSHWSPSRPLWALACLLLALVVASSPPIEELRACVTSEELRKTFRRLALELHPDRVKDAGLEEEAAELFARVRAVYETMLADFDAKVSGASAGVASSSWNDEWRHHCVRSARAVAAQGTSPSGSAGYTVSQGIAGAGGTGPVLDTVTLTYAQVIQGAKLPFLAESLLVCPHCAGKGHVHSEENRRQGGGKACGVCAGHGYKLGSRVLGKEEDEAVRDGSPHPSGGAYDSVQYTCASCCGSGVEMQSCASCNGTGLHSTHIKGHVVLPAGMKPEVPVELGTVFVPDDAEEGGGGGEEGGGGRQGGGGEEEGPPPPQYRPTHVQVAYNTSWESTKGFIIAHSALVKVARMSLTSYCTIRAVSVEMPLGGPQVLPLGPDDHLEHTTAAERAASVERLRASKGGYTVGGGTDAEGRPHTPRPGRELSGVHTLRMPGQGLPFKRASGLPGLGDAILVLRLSFPDRLGADEEELLWRCSGEDPLQVGLVRSTALLLAGVQAADAPHDDVPPRQLEGLHRGSSALDPLTTTLLRWAWWGL